MRFRQESVFVPAVIDQFGFCVEARQFFFAEDDVFFSCAQVAPFCAVVVGGGMV